MSERSFVVTAVWDDEAKVYYSESDIVGLHIEADTLEEFLATTRREAPELVFANHFDGQDIAHSTLADLIPTIFMQTRAVAIAAE